jgi:hydrogenase maturation factor HypE
LSALLLSACGEKSAEEATVVAPAETATLVAEPLESAPVAVESGGYVPTADELVLGITRTKEEQDKINAEAMSGTPMPVIPGEAAPAPAESPVDAPVDAAPEAK